MKDCRIASSAILLLLMTLPARTVTDPAYGYSLEIPTGWHEVPKSIIDREMSKFANPGAVNFVTGFEPDSHTEPLMFPYVFVEVFDYPAGTLNLTISEDELRDLAARFRKHKAGPNESLTPYGQSVIKATGENSVSYFTTPPGLTMDLVATANGMEVGTHSVALIGRHRIILVHYYNRQSEFASDKDAMDTFMKSFKLDSAEAITLVPNPAPSLGKKGPVGGQDLYLLAGRATASLLIIGIVVVAAGIIVRSARKRT
jgi:hypothetical protein